jgi:hypothetical protein
VVDDVRIFTCATPPPPVSSGGGDATPPPPPVAAVGPARSTLKSAKLKSCKISGKGKKLRVKCTLSSPAPSAARRSPSSRARRRCSRNAQDDLEGVLSVKPRRKLTKGSYKVSIVIATRPARSDVEKGAQVR